ncbi:MAG TPA: ADYC domain-containing protein [Kofleriaceae bacterium]|nr:ADYC domain-containing protein [Kofleriaceae bacterium]
MRRAAWGMVAVGLAACAATPDAGGGSGPGDDGVVAPGDPGNDGHDQLVAPLQGMEAQGQDLLGAMLDQIGHEEGYHANLVTDAVTADGVPVKVTFDGSAALRSGSHRGADPYFNGMLLTGSGGARLRLSVVRGGYDVAFYRVELKNGASWVDLCPAADGSAGDAIPLAGKWQRTGFHEHAPDRFSFACAGSVAYKCTVWGYLAGSDDTSLGWRAHQACTRMARGDYCANGEPHTREGTLIKIYDFAGVTSPPPLSFDGVAAWPPNTDRLFFEAAWSDGAHPAACLSRLRWQSLPLGPLCNPANPGDPPELPDPRQDTTAAFCEDIQWPDPGAAPAGALLFNESYYMDLALHVWQDGTDYVSTVRGLYDPPATRQPFTRTGNYVHVAVDGMMIRSLRTVVDPEDFLEVHVYGTPGDRVVAASAPPGFNDLGFEGYVRKTPTPRAVAFNLYQHPDGDYLSTAGPPPPDYVLLETIGYIQPAETR